MDSEGAADPFPYQPRKNYTPVFCPELAGSGLFAFNRWEVQSRLWHSYRLPRIAGVGERLR